MQLATLPMTDLEHSPVALQQQSTVDGPALPVTMTTTSVQASTVTRLAEPASTTVSQVSATALPDSGLSPISTQSDYSRTSESTVSSGQSRATQTDPSSPAESTPVSSSAASQDGVSSVDPSSPSSATQASDGTSADPVSATSVGLGDVVVSLLASGQGDPSDGSPSSTQSGAEAPGEPTQADPAIISSTSTATTLSGPAGADPNAVSGSQAISSAGDTAGPITIGSSVLTVKTDSGGNLVVGSITLYASDPAQTVAGQLVSAGSNAFVVGSGDQVTTISIQNDAGTGDPSSTAHSAAAQQTSIDGQVYSVSENDNAGYVIADPTTTVSIAAGQATDVGGQVLTAGSTGLSAPSAAGDPSDADPARSASETAGSSTSSGSNSAGSAATSSVETSGSAGIRFQWQNHLACLILVAVMFIHL